MLDRYLACTECDWDGHHSQADRAGLDRACPDCGAAVRLQSGDHDE